MTKLAKALGISPMGLYTYFESRDDLLDAVADHVLSIFPSSLGLASCWQDEVRAWLSRLHDHLYNHPFALDLLAWDGHISAAWFKAWLPIYRLLRQQGLEGDALRFALTWFLQVALGTMTSIRKTADFDLTSTSHDFSTLAAEDRELLSGEIVGLYSVDGAAVLQFSFDTIVSGLEVLIARSKTNPHR